MKKTLSIIIAIVTLIACATNAFAEQKTVLSTTVPEAQYTLNIPEDQEITYGKEQTNIGDVTVTNSSKFAEGKNLSVKIEFDDFSCKDTETTIPYKLAFNKKDDYYHYKVIESGDCIIFRGKANGTVDEHLFLDGVFADILYVEVASVDWGKALAGDYSSTITFTAKVVVADDE